MYQPMLRLHWKQVRWGLLPFILGAYALPLIAVQGLGAPRLLDVVTLEAYRVVAGFQVWLPAFPLLAAAVGITLALSAWNWDHQLKHVYALSLPISRWRYATLKMAAGATLALIPAGALWIGAHVAAASVALPAGLNAYPNHLALRFLMASLVAYAGFFALAAGTVRTTVWILSAIVLFLVFGNTLTDFLAGYFPVFYRVNVVEMVFEALMRAPGPFEVFTGNWMLIDV